MLIKCHRGYDLMRKYVVALLAVLGTFAPSINQAAETDAAAESPWKLGIALGYGERSNPLINSDDFTIVIDVDIAWFGERFFFDNGDVGLTLFDLESATVNLIGRFNSDRVFFGKINSQFISVGGTALEPDGVAEIETVPVPDRDYAVELGLELLTDGNWGVLQAAFHHDVSGVHDGYEVFVNYGYGFRKQRWFFEPSIGLNWKSEKLNNYFWGVRESEATSQFAAYQAGAGLNAHLRLLASYQLSKHVAVSAAVEYERLNSEAASSTIVEEDDVLGVYAGFSYRF